MSAWLRTLGHEVTVLTTRAWGTPADDGPWIVRTGDLVASRPLRRMLSRPSLDKPEAPPPLRKLPPRVLSDVVVPDAYLLSWVPGTVSRARRLIAERAIDCLVTSGPPQSSHLLGLLLGRSRPAWIADFRDGWRHEMLRPPWPTSAQEHLDAELERRVVAAAELVVGVTKPIADDFASRRGARAVHIPNGWDPRGDAKLSAARRPVLDRQFVNVVHTGQLSGSRGRDPRALFEALDELRRTHPGASARLRIVLAGSLDAAEQELLTALPPSAGVIHVGFLERYAAAALQRDADALLLLTSTGHASQATGKLYEYLTAGRPIIALASDNEAARIVTETGTGITVPPNDPQAIARVLLAVVQGQLQAAYAARNLERYVYPAPAVAFAAEIEHALSVSASRRASCRARAAARR